MKQKKTLRFLLLTLLLVLTPLTVAAQAAADQLFMKGQELQAKGGTNDIKNAITYYTKARNAYDSAAKKTMCTKQINICRQLLKKPKTPKPVVKEGKDNDKTPEVVEKKPAREPAQLSLSVSTIEAKAKGGTETINIFSNYPDWKVELPDWITSTRNDTHLTLIIAKNEAADVRTAVITVNCYEATAQLHITQKGAGLAKVKDAADAVKGIFKKKKDKK